MSLPSANDAIARVSGFSLKFIHKILLATTAAIILAFAAFTFYIDLKQSESIRVTIESRLHEVGQLTADGTNEVLMNVSAVTQASGLVGDAAGRLLTSASELSTLSDQLRQEVQTFLTRVRAA